MPAGDTLKGAWLIVSLGISGATEAFEIDRVTVNGGQTQIFVKDEVGLWMKAGTTDEIFFPRRKFHGQNRFTIQARAMTN